MTELAISNLAWDAHHDEAVAEVLREAGVRCIEIAPTKVWSKPLEAPMDAVRQYRRAWENRGLRIVALQSLLFGRLDLSVLGSPTVQRQTIDYLKGIITIAAELGAGPLVFGSPKNRRRGDMSLTDAMDRCAPLFRELGDYAGSLDTCLCLEPNPPQYGCDFITTSDEAAELVQMVDSPGFALHLDLTCMEMAGEDPAEAIHRHRSLIRHFHVSAPQLGPVRFASTTVWMRQLDEAQAEWRGIRPIVSVEMVSAPDGDPVGAVRQAVSAAA